VEDGDDETGEGNGGQSHEDGDRLVLVAVDELAGPRGDNALGGFRTGDAVCGVRGAVRAGVDRGVGWLLGSDRPGIAAMLANSKSAGTTALPTISLVPGPGVFPAARIIDRGRDTPR
jgi:hypothetical protein